MVFVTRSHNIDNLVQGEQPQNSGGIGVGSLLSAENLQYLWNRAKQKSQDQGYYWWPIRNCMRAFDWCQNQRPWRAIMHALRFKTHASFGAHHENLNEDRSILSGRWCSPVTLVSGNIRLMWIFAGVPWRGSIKRQCCNRRHGFSGLSDATSSAP